jgi:hypothetical protein
MMTRLMRMAAAALTKLYERDRTTTIMSETTDYDISCNNGGGAGSGDGGCSGDDGDHHAQKIC